MGKPSQCLNSCVHDSQIFRLFFRMTILSASFVTHWSKETLKCYANGPGEAG